MPVDVRAVIDRYNRRKMDRHNWESAWSDLADYYLPARSVFFGYHTPGERRSKQYDSIPVLMAKETARGMDGMLMPASGQWIQYLPEDGDQEDLSRDGKLWLEDAEEWAHRHIYFSSSGFVRQSYTTTLDLTVFGNGCLFMPARSDLKGVRFKAKHLRDVTIDEDELGRIRPVWFETRLEAAKAAEKWGRDSLGSSAKAALDSQSTDKQFTYLQFIAPREDRDVRRVDNGNMPFASFVIELESQEVVSEGGFRSWPIAFPRWDVQTDEKYGRSMTDDSLPDAKSANVMMRDLLTAANWATNPPKWALGGAIVGANNLMPGHWIYGDLNVAQEFGARPFGTIEHGGDLGMGKDVMDMTHSTLSRAFMQHLFNLPTDKERMNALLVRGIMEQQIRMLAPLLTALDRDYPAAIADRVLSEGLWQGLIPLPPDELRDREIGFKLGAPIQRAKAQLELATLATSMEMMVALLQLPTFAQAADNLDADTIIRDVARLNDNPERWLVDEKTRDAGRAQQAQMAQIQFALEAAKTGADAQAKAAAAQRTGGAQ